MIKIIKKDLLISNKKSILTATQSVWAVNKYFVLACSQTDYNKVRKLLRSDNLDIKSAYHILKKVNDVFQLIPSGELPEISNALYHMAGYFKKQLSKEKRDHLIYLIEDSPTEALIILEELTKGHNQDYLLKARIWVDLRNKPFNLIRTKLKDSGITYNSDELVWIEDHLTYL